LSGNPINPANPRVRILRDDKPIAVDNLAGITSMDGWYPLTAYNATSDPGHYKFSFIPGRMQGGLYQLEFAGDIAGHTLLVPGVIALGELTRLQGWLNRIRMGLMDDFPELYRLDEPVHQWEPEQLWTFVQEALGRLNSFGPRPTNYDADTLPANADEFLVTGAKIWALYARARLEKANEMSYSDQHSLDIKRADFYKGLADTLYKDWMEAVIQWKKATPPRPIGMRSQQLPFAIGRVIGLLPHYQTYFSG
jgi:hypothetical protein